MKRPDRESGNIFFMLFAAVAVVGVLGATTVKVMRGPLNTMVEVNRRTAAESQIAITSKLGMMTSALQANSGDCETSPNEDGYVEPMEWVDASGAGPDGVAGSEGGGWLPDEYGVTKKDPWGSNYGYCVWDAGPVVNNPGCGGASQKRLQGSGTDNRTYPVIALISAGPDRTFQTGCLDFATADANSNGTLESTEKMVVKASGSDDLVMQYTYSEASVTAGGLWELKSGAPDTAVTAKNVEIGGTATFSGGVSVGPTGSGDFPTVKTDIIQPLSPTQPAPEFTAGLMLSNTATAGNTCLGTELGRLSVDAATPTQLLACLDNSGTSEWITIGGANFLWQEGATAGEIYYNGGNIGIGTNDPNLPLDIVGDAGLTGDLRLTDTHSVLWGDGTTSVRGSGPGSVEFLTGGATRVAVDSSGLVGIGVAPAASTRLIVQGTGTTNATTALSITDSAGAPVLSARDNAQVGIGNAAPNDALDVTGSVAATDSFKIDGNVVLYVPNGVDENILVGKAAGAAVTGDNNAVLGASAAVSLGAGTDNLIAGQASAIALDGGSFNTVLGQGAGSTLVSGDRNILIGASDTTPIDVPAAGTDDYLNIGNTIFGDLANDYVGIGVASPNDALDVAGNIDATGNINTGSNFTINSVVFGPASQCTATQKLQWSNASGWSCVTDLNDGSSGTPQDLESVLTAGNDANTLTAVNLGGVAIGSTTLSTGGTQNLVLDVTGAAGADFYCDADGNNCFSAASVGSIDTFLELTDTPVNYTGAGTWLVRVNAGGTGLEFVNPSTLSTSAAGNTGEIQFNNAGVFAASSNFFWDNAAVELGIGTNTPGASLDIATTDSVILPRGTTGERSGTPANGMIRYNNTANKFEVYENGAWKYLQTGAGTSLAYIELSDTPAVYTGAAYKLAMVNPTGTGMIFSYNDAVLLPSGTTAQRPGTATNGMIRYNQTTSKFEVYQAGAWVSLITSGTGSAIAIDDLTDALADYGANSNLIMGRSGATALAAGAQYNTFLGLYAGATTANSTSTTDSNTAVGQQALASLTSGSSNTASGRSALYSNTTGVQNTASGQQTLYANTTGSRNTASGYLALFSNTTGSNHTAIGYQTLQLNSTGNNNVAIGYNALQHNSTGSNNTASGIDTLSANTTGDYNTANGASALGSNTTGSDNTASGTGALYFNTTGNYNTASGDNALFSNVAKSNSTAIGYQAMYNADDTATAGNANNTALGYQALRGSAIASNNTGTNNLALGYQALLGATSGGNNVAVGAGAGDAITTGANNIVIGYNVDTPAATTSNFLDIGDTIYGDLSTDQIRIGGSGALSGFSDLDIAGTLAVKLSSGTTAERPGTATNGMIRYNSTANKFEVYENGAWKYLQTGAGTSLAYIELSDTPAVYTGAAYKLAMVNPTGTGMIFSYNDAVLLPAGTTAERPASSTAGMIRYNSTTNVFEGYVDDGTPAWEPINTGAGGLWTDLTGGRIHYGTTNANQVGVGVADPKAPLHVAGEVIVGPTSGLACDADRAGGVRYNAGGTYLEYCNGTAWRPLLGSAAGTVLTITPAADTAMDVTGPGSPATGTTVNFIVTNVGDTTSSALSYTITGLNPGNFVVTGENCTGATLAASATCQISIQPQASSNGLYSATLTVPEHNAPFASMQGTGSGFGCVEGQSAYGGKIAKCDAFGAGKHFVVTPGGCTNSTTPTCAGGNDTTTKAWSSSAAYDESVLVSSLTEGPQNTVNLMQLHNAGGTAPAWYHAAAYCADMNYGGYTDWYLPAPDELVNFFYPNRVAVGGYVAAVYWTSRGSSGSASTLSSAGTQSSQGKTSVSLTRCARREGVAEPAAVADTTPDSTVIFPTAFAASAGVRTSSAVVTVTGITPGTAVSVSGSGSPTIKINGGAEVASGTVKWNDTVQVVMDSPAANGRSEASVTIGTATLPFSVITRGNCGGSCAGVDKRVFVTSTTYTGNLGGLAGADAKCQARADAATLGGTWRAIISGDASADWAVNRMDYNWDRLVNMNGQVVATSPADLWDGTLTNGIGYDATGASASGQLVWTGGDLSGFGYTDIASGYSTCSSWTTTTGFLRWANAGATNAQWWSSGGSGTACGTSRAIYCAEVTTPGVTLAITPAIQNSMDVTGPGAPATGSAVTFTVENTGTGASAALAMSVDNVTNFEIMNDTCTGNILAPAATCTLDVRPRAYANGTYSGVLSAVSSGAPTATAALSGTAASFLYTAGQWYLGVDPGDLYYSGGPVGIGTNDPDVSLDIVGTDAVRIPVGTTAQQPTVPAAGMIRYNSTTNVFEGYVDDGTPAWEPINTGAGGLWTDLTGGRIHYGTTNANQVGVGVADPKAPLHVAGEAIIGPTSGLACDADRTGGIRWSAADLTFEMCDGTQWKKIVATGSGASFTPPAGAGYFVMSNGTWDGDLKTAAGAASGIVGASNLCLSDLLANNWLGKSDAQARGMLDSAHVRGFICNQFSCNNLIPSTQYVFAVSGNPAAGGASFTTDASGRGPQDANNWSSADKFGGNYTYWTNRKSSGNSTYWDTTPSSTASGAACGNWANNTGSVKVGISNNVTELRWESPGTHSCASSYNLICYVDPAGGGGADLTPDAFTFTALTNQVMNTVVASNSVVVAGFDGPLEVNVTGPGSPQLRVNGGAWGNSLNISPGDTLEIRQTTSPAPSTSRAALVTLGTAAVDWVVTTAVGEVPVGNTGLTCDAGAAGTVRYNSGGTVMEFCNGTAWASIGGGKWGDGVDVGDIYYSGGPVGIGTNDPDVSLDISGTDALIVPRGTTAQRPGTPVNGMIRYNTTVAGFEVYENGAWVAMGAAVSDIRLKTDIKPLDREEIVAKLMQIDTYSFRLKADQTGRENMGVIAQEIEKIFPDLVDGEGDAIRSVHYVELIAPLIETAQYLKIENDAMKADVSDLKDQVALLNKAAVGNTGKASMDGWTMLLLGLLFGGNAVLLVRLGRRRA